MLKDSCLFGIIGGPFNSGSPSNILNPINPASPLRRHGSSKLENVNPIMDINNPTYVVNNVTFSSGLTIDKVKDANITKIFTDIDLDDDKILSQEEILLYKKKQAINFIQQEKERFEKGDSIFKYMSVLGGFLATVTTIDSVLNKVPGPAPFLLFGLTLITYLGKRKLKNAMTTCDSLKKDLELKVQKETQQILYKAKEVK